MYITYFLGFASEEFLHRAQRPAGGPGRQDRRQGAGEGHRRPQVKFFRHFFFVAAHHFATAPTP